MGLIRKTIRVILTRVEPVTVTSVEQSRCSFFLNVQSILVGDKPLNYHVLVAISIPLGLKCRNCGILLKKMVNFESDKGMN